MKILSKNPDEPCAVKFIASKILVNEVKTAQKVSVQNILLFFLI